MEHLESEGEIAVCPLSSLSVIEICFRYACRDKSLGPVRKQEGVLKENRSGHRLEIRFTRFDPGKTERQSRIEPLPL